jgi:hypothetical protein
MPHKAPAARVAARLRVARLRSVARKAKSKSRPARKSSQRVSIGLQRERVPKDAPTIPGRMPSCNRLESKGRRPICRAKQKTLQAQATCRAVWPVPKARRIKEYRNGYTGATCAVGPVFIVAKGSANVPLAARERATRTASEPDDTSNSLRRPSGSRVNRTKLTAVTTTHQCAKVHLGNLSTSKSWGIAFVWSDMRISCFKADCLHSYGGSAGQHAYSFSREFASTEAKEFAGLSIAARPGKTNRKRPQVGGSWATHDPQTNIPPSRRGMRVGQFGTAKKLLSWTGRRLWPFASTILRSGAASLPERRLPRVWLHPTDVRTGR